MSSYDAQTIEKMPIHQLRQYRSAAQYDSGESRPGYRLKCRYCSKIPVYCFCTSPIFDEVRKEVK